MKQLYDWFIGGGLITMFFAIVGIANCQGKKIDRVYGRFDEYKDSVKKDFVQKDLCKLIHDNNKAQYDQLLQRFDRIESKIDKINKSA